MTKRIKEEKKNAEYVYNKIIQETIKTISLSKDEHLKDKASDIASVSARVLNKLLGLKQYSIESISSPVVIVAPSLSPGDVVKMRKGRVMGFATDTGGRTSHVVL